MNTEANQFINGRMFHAIMAHAGKHFSSRLFENLRTKLFYGRFFRFLSRIAFHLNFHHAPRLQDAQMTFGHFHALADQELSVSVLGIDGQNTPRLQ